MKAYEVRQFRIENLSLVERPDPPPAAQEVMVKFHAASVNYRDLMFVERLPAVSFSDASLFGCSDSHWRVRCFEEMNKAIESNGLKSV
jgi:hypothetical protein